MVRRRLIVFGSLLVSAGLMGAAVEENPLVIAARTGSLSAVYTVLRDKTFDAAVYYEALEAVPPASRHRRHIASLLGAASVTYSDAETRSKKLADCLLTQAAVGTRSGSGGSRAPVAVPATTIYTEEALQAMDPLQIYHVLKLALRNRLVDQNFVVIQALYAAKKIVIDLNRKESGETLLTLAVCYRLEAVVTWLLENGAEASIDVCSDACGDTPLMIAARFAHAPMVSQLLTAGARPELTNCKGETARELAAFSKGVRIFGKSLCEGAEQCIGLIDCVLRMRGGRRIAHVSLEEQTRARNALAACTTSLDEPDKDGKTLLHNAARLGDLPICIEVLENSPKMISMPDREGWQPLHHAARAGHYDIARLLVFYGADPLATTKHGKTAETIARETGGYAAVCGLIAAMYAGNNKRNPAEVASFFDTTLLIDALFADNSEAVAALLAESTADINSRFAGYTPLQHAAMRLNEPMVKLLLRYGADKMAKSVDNFTSAQLLKAHKDRFEAKDRARYVAMLKLVS